MSEELTPRQSEFLKSYLDPKSKTFSNAYQSALKAGFSEDYAKTILSQDIDWLSENLRDNKLVVKALKNLNSLLGSDDERVMADLTKFTLSRLNKAKFGDSQEVTHIIPKPLDDVSEDNGIQENKDDDQEDKSDSGGNISKQDSEHPPVFDSEVSV